MSLVQVSMGFLVPLAIHEYVYLFKIKLFKKYSNFTIEVNGIRYGTSCYINQHTGYSCNLIHKQQILKKSSQSA